MNINRYDFFVQYFKRFKEATIYFKCLEVSVYGV